MSAEVKSYRIVVTGATGGLGEAMVQSLLLSGSKHIVVGTTRSLANGRVAALQRWAGEQGGDVSERLSFVELDYSSDESVSRGVAAARDKLGEVDVVINNAGVGFNGLVESFTAEQYLEQLNINVVGPHRVNRAILPSMRARGSGTIINVSSCIGRRVVPFFGVYSSSKFALEAQSEALRLELNPLGVQVLVVEPGAIATPFHAAVVQPDDAAVLLTDGYPPVAARAAAMRAGFVQAMTDVSKAPPSAVGDAVVQLIETPPAQRPFRTIVDPFSGGADVAQINALSESLLAENLARQGCADMLTLAGQHT